MEKRSPRLAQQTEKTQINCMWRLMSSFYFGKNHRKQKLLSNGKNAAKHVIGTENERKIDSLTYFNHQFYEDGAEEEDFGLFDQQISKYRPSSKKVYKNESSLYDWNGTETGSFHPDSGLAELSISKLRLESKLEAICNQIHQENGHSQRSTSKNDQLEEINLQLLQMSAKAFLDQMFIDRKYNRKCGVSYESERFSDALDMLNSNGDLFLKHLQDPNSLLTKQIRNLQNLQMARESVKSLLNNKLSDDDQGCDSDMWKSKKKNYRSAYSSKEIPCTPPSNKIVVLKPTPRTVRCSENVSCHCSSMQSHHSTGSKVKNVKSKNFSLKDVKRKLKYATGEKLNDKHRLTITGAVNTSNESNTKKRAEMKREYISSESPKVTVLTETVQKKLDVSAIHYSKQRELDIFLEAKKHLYQRLRTVNTGEAVMSRQPSRTLGGILSSPEHDLSINSPKMDSETISVQMRLSPFGNYQMAEAEVAGDIICYAKGDLKHNDTSILESPPEPANTGVQSPQKDEDRTHMKSSMDSPTQVWTPDSSTDVSLTSPSSNYKLRVVENTLDRQDYLSPVSVLDSIFMNDLASPSGTANQPSDTVLQPCCIDFEECSYNESPHCPVSNHIAELDALGIHIQSNLQTLHSNWEELWVNSPLQEQMLRVTLFDDLLESSALECHRDPQLLMDSTYEVLLEAYNYHFRFPPWLSFLQPKIQPFPLEDHLLEKVMKQVRQHLVPVMEQPTLDQLVGNDLAKTDSWLDIRSDIEDVLTQIVDRVLQESILDTVLQLHNSS